MPKPRFTDKNKWNKAHYPDGYVNAQNTNISETFRRIREEQQKNALEAKDKVLRMKTK